MARDPHFLVLDQGSHASKALVFDSSGELFARSEVPLATRRPRPGWVEHDADELLGTLRQAIDAVFGMPGVAEREFAAAGLAIQRSSIVCWDRVTGAALSPVLSWQDRRNADWLAAQDFDPARLRDITGLVASPHYGASKLRWCLDQLPEVRRALAAERLCCGPLASFVLHRLLVEHPLLVDPANASRTLLWDVQRRDWSAQMLTACGIPLACLPRCVPSRHAFGTLRAGRQKIPMEAVTGDQPAALFAWGRPDERTLFVNIGTGAFVQQLAEGRPPAVPGLLQSVAWQDAQLTISVLEGTVNGAGSALEWLATARNVPLETLIAGAEGWLREIDEPPLFINGVGGLGAPYWVADCPIFFSGDGSVAGQTVAVLESIVYLLQVNIAALRASTDAPGAVQRIIVSGGIAQFDGVCQRLADLSGLQLERPADIEATAHGLAWLLGCPETSRHDSTARYAPQPNPRLHARFGRWRAALHAALPGLVETGSGA
jgi:glycerol kinase